MIKYNASTMKTVNEVKEILKKNFVPAKIGATRFIVKDVTMGNSFGYDWALVKAEYKAVEYNDENGKILFTANSWEPIEIVATTIEVRDDAGKNAIGGIGCIRSVFMLELIKKYL